MTRQNLLKAMKRVKANKGAAGIDAMAIDQTVEYLKHHWPRIRAGVLAGTYRPSPVRRVAIPKPGGGARALGIPTAVDRLIQQAPQHLATKNAPEGAFGGSLLASFFGLRRARAFAA